MAGMGLDDVFAVVLRRGWSVRWDAEHKTGIVYCLSTGREGDTLIDLLPGEDRKEFRYWLWYRGMMLASYWDANQKDDLSVAWEFVKLYLGEQGEGAALDIQGAFPQASCDILVALAVNRAQGRLTARVEGERLLYKLVPLKQEAIQSVETAPHEEREMVAA